MVVFWMTYFHCVNYNILRSIPTRFRLIKNLFVYLMTWLPDLVRTCYVMLVLSLISCFARWMLNLKPPYQTKTMYLAPFTDTGIRDTDPVCYLLIFFYIIVWLFLADKNCGISKCNITLLVPFGWSFAVRPSTILRTVSTGGPNFITVTSD